MSDPRGKYKKFKMTQIIAMDDRDYIIEFKNFNRHEDGLATKYFNKLLTQDKVVKIQAKKWQE